MIIAVMTIPAALGFAALAVEGGLWYADHHQLRNVADAAALASGWARREGNNEHTAWAAAVPEIGYNPDTDEVVVVSPPTHGAYAGEADAIEVTVRRQRPLVMSSLFLHAADVNIEARSVVRMRTRGATCGLALDPAAAGAITIAAGATVTLGACGLSVNSHAATALNISPTGILNTAWADVTGGIETNGGGVINSTAAPEGGAQQQIDPYSNLSPPASGACNYTNLSVTSGTRILYPGRYCGGIAVSPGARATLYPGIFIVDGGTVSVAGGATVTGNSVSIIMTGSGSNYARAAISSGATMRVSAPHSGAYNGIAWMQDRNAPAAGSNHFGGGAGMDIGGVIYIPRQNVDFSGGNANGTYCTRVIAGTVTFSGNTVLGDNCASYALPEHSDDDPQIVG